MIAVPLAIRPDSGISYAFNRYTREYDISMEDLIPNENTIITMTKLGYIKRMTVDNFKSQHRGGKGIKGMQTILISLLPHLPSWNHG